MVFEFRMDYKKYNESLGDNMAVVWFFSFFFKSKTVKSRFDPPHKQVTITIIWGRSRSCNSNNNTITIDSNNNKHLPFSRINVKNPKKGEEAYCQTNLHYCHNGRWNSSLCWKGRRYPTHYVIAWKITVLIKGLNFVFCIVIEEIFFFFFFFLAWRWGCEYTDGNPLSKVRPFQKGFKGVKLNYIWRWSSCYKDMGSEKDYFIAITPSSTKTRYGNISYGPVYGLNRTVDELFVFDGPGSSK